MKNFILILLILVIVGAALLYIRSRKKKGTKCIGCPGNCSGCPCNK